MPSGAIASRGPCSPSKAERLKAPFCIRVFPVQGGPLPRQGGLIQYPVAPADDIIAPGLGQGTPNCSLPSHAFLLHCITDPKTGIMNRNVTSRDVAALPNGALKRSSRRCSQYSNAYLTLSLYRQIQNWSSRTVCILTAS